MALKYDKVWIEVDVRRLDVEQDNKKTNVLNDIITSLSSCDSVLNVTKIQYKRGHGEEAE